MGGVMSDWGAGKIAEAILAAARLIAEAIREKKQ
jgi:hypothetical protein